MKTLINHLRYRFSCFKLILFNISGFFNVLKRFSRDVSHFFHFFTLFLFFSDYLEFHFVFSRFCDFSLQLASLCIWINRQYALILFWLILCNCILGILMQVSPMMKRKRFAFLWERLVQDTSYCWKIIP